MRAILRVVTAFTVGHSITLALCGLGAVGLPSAWIETGIALSVLVTALHALRPMFPRETVLAGGFGLLYGMAFAGSLVGHGLGRAQEVWTLLGFNLGIELAQLGLLALVLPWLLLLARSLAYEGFRIACAGAIAAVSLSWFLARSLGLPDVLIRPVGWLQGHPLHLLVALAVVAVSASLAGSKQRRTERVAPSGVISA